MSQTQYHLRNVRKLLMRAFDLEELRQICFEVPEFRPVYDNFTDARKDELIRRLIERCDRKGLMGTLLEVVEEEAPETYAEFAGQLTVGSEPAPVVSPVAANAPDLTQTTVAHLQNLIAEKTQQLYYLQNQAAGYGPLDVPLRLHTQIKTLEQEIEELQQRLADL